MYQEMASRHRVRASSISIIKNTTPAPVPGALCKRDNVTQSHDSKISFPVTHKLARYVHCSFWNYSQSLCFRSVLLLSRQRPSNCRLKLAVVPCRASDRRFKSVFKAVRPNVAVY